MSSTPEEFNFDNRGSLGDNKVHDIDNLKEHMDLLQVDDDHEPSFEEMQASSQKKNGGARRPTLEDQNEFKSAHMLKRKKTLGKELHEVKIHDFKLLTVLGRGAFGKVYLGELKQNQKLYAIKVIRKDVLLEQD